MHELLTPDQMNKADQLTIAGGVSGFELMENAGRAIADVLVEHFGDAGKILVVCGTGNNGGDGLIAARILSERRLVVDLIYCGEQNSMSGDAALANERLGAGVNIISEADFQEYDLIIDAIFGAGLNREVTGKIAQLIAAVNDCPVPTLSVDLPSGIDGASGKILGNAIKADATITFFRKKPGHVLYPGRKHCGRLFVRQIGIRQEVLGKTGICAFLNRPEIWRSVMVKPASDGHKHDRGHTLVVSGPLAMSGASRLVAGAALRVGSGLVSIVGSKDVVAVNAAQLTTIMLQEAENVDDLKRVLVDKRFNSIVIGPGILPDQSAREAVLALLATERQTVLDAGALSAFAGQENVLFAAIKSNGRPVVLTPHEGEFSRLFGDQNSNVSKIERAIAAAKISGAIIVLKGPDSVVATPQGRACVCDNAPPWLATAGSGDVLAGIIAGFLAQTMPAYEAGASAVWIHADAANRLGPPLIASDLDQGLRQSISALYRGLFYSRACQV